MPTKWKNVMIDLETLSTDPYALPIQIGARCFDLDTGELGPSFERSVVTKSKQFLMDLPTVKFWLSQPKEVIDRVFASPISLAKALDYLNAFFIQNTSDDVRVWANGASFDFPILQHAFRVEKNKMAPWQYKYERDARTFVKQWEVKWDKPLEHGALADCDIQVRGIVEAWKRQTWSLKRMKEVYPSWSPDTSFPGSATDALCCELPGQLPAKEVLRSRSRTSRKTRRT